MVSSSKDKTGSTTSSQAWAILRRHARDEISRLRLQELCRDSDRVTSLVSVYNARTPGSNSMLMVDLSRQRMTLETLNHLLRLGTARGLPNFIRQLSWGQNDPEQPVVPKRLQELPQNIPEKRKHHQRPVCNIPSYHMALRVPSGKNMEMLARDGTNVLVGIHNDWDRIRRISESLRRGKLPGVTGGMITDVVVVGNGLAVIALQFAYQALCRDEAATIGRRFGIDGGPQGQHHRKSSSGGGLITGHRRMKFLTTVDPVGAAAVIADVDPATTLVITIAMEEETEGTMLATQTLHTWLLTALGAHGKRPEVILSKHAMLVTSHEELADRHKPESVFLTPDHSRCESFTTFTAASLLPLSITFGWPTVEAFLSGAHDIDQHFVETNPRHNLPVLLALTDIWNDCLLPPNAGRVVKPYTEALAFYPAFVAALEAQTCGRQRANDSSSSAAAPWMSSMGISHSTTAAQSSSSPCCSSVVMDGGLHGIYDRSLHYSPKIVPSEFVTTLNSQLSTNGAPLKGGPGVGSRDIQNAQDAVICSLFAHADGLAFGPDKTYSDENNFDRHVGFVDQLQQHQNQTGNRPSTLLLCARLDAFTCGQFIALAEHRAAVKAWIWEIDPFPISSKSFGSSKRIDLLKESLAKMMLSEEEDEEDDDEEEGEANGGLNLSTKTILRHYATMVKGQRRNAINNS